MEIIMHYYIITVKSELVSESLKIIYNFFLVSKTSKCLNVPIY